MSRSLSLLALSTLLLATAVEAYPGGMRNVDGYRGTMDQPQGSVTSRLASTGGLDSAPMQGDNCGVDGYPWLKADGQPLEG